MRNQFMGVAALCAVVVFPAYVFAQGTGSITGMVTNRITREPLAGVSVTVQATAYGSITKDNGTYTILGLPQGTYNIVARRVGLAQVTISDVVVAANVARPLDITMAPVPTLAAGLSSCGPSIAFGVTGFRASELTYTTPRDSVHPVFTFGAEPTVTDAWAGSPVHIGDVIVAVGGNPITTRAGADKFIYPMAADTLLTVRRNGANVDLHYAGSALNVLRSMVSSRQGDSTFYRRGDSVLYQLRSASLCVFPSIAPAAAGRGGLGAGAAAGGCVGGGGGGGRGGARVGGGAAGQVISPPGGVFGGGAGARGRASAPAQIVEQGVLPTMGARITDAVALTNFDLRLLCSPNCTRGRADDGTDYWKFDGYPRISFAPNAKPDDVRSRTGLEEGDILIAVNGESPLTDKGAMILSHADRELSLKLEVSRNGKRRTVTLKL